MTARCPICRELLVPSLTSAPRCYRCGELGFSQDLGELLATPLRDVLPPPPIDSPVRGAFCLDWFLDRAREEGSRLEVLVAAGNVLLDRLPEAVAARARLGDLSFALAFPDVVEVAPGRKASFHRLLELDLEGTGTKGEGWLLGYTLERKRGDPPRGIEGVFGPHNSPQLVKSWGQFRTLFGDPGELSLDNAELVRLAGRALLWVDDGGLP